MGSKGTPVRLRLQSVTLEAECGAIVVGSRHGIDSATALIARRRERSGRRGCAGCQRRTIIDQSILLAAQLDCSPQVLLDQRAREVAPLR